MLRFSYDGTGDSSGTLEDPERVRAWEDSVVRAVGVLREAGVDRVGAVGMRLGAALLTRAAASLVRPLDALVLWDPCVSGREFVRYQRALMGTLPGEPAADETGFDTPGYFFPTSLADELGQVSIAAPSDPGPPTLVLTRPEGSNRRLERALAGGRVEWATALGQEVLLDVPPLSAEVPRRTIGEITGWLSGRLEGPEGPVVVPATSAPPSATVGVDARGRAIREHALRLGDLGLFAIATEPEGGGRGPWMVFLNVATEHHIGPGRQWVELARAWAGHGLRSLRVDFSGVGDSPVRPGQVANVTYAPEWLDDLSVISATVAPRDPSDTAWIGLCSGGYGALEAALMVGARGAYVLNPSLSSTSMNKSSAQADPRRRAFRPYPVPLARLSVKHGRTAATLWRAWQQVAVGQAPLAVPASLVRAGIDVLLVCGPDDARPLRDSWYWRSRGEPRLRRTGRFELAVVPSLDHVLLFGQGRRAAVRILTEHVVGRYGDRAPAVDSPPAVDLPPAVPITVPGPTAATGGTTRDAEGDERRPSAPAASDRRWHEDVGLVPAIGQEGKALFEDVPRQPGPSVPEGVPHRVLDRPPVVPPVVGQRPVGRRRPGLLRPCLPDGAQCLQPVGGIDAGVVAGVLPDEGETLVEEAPFGVAGHVDGHQPVLGAGVPDGEPAGLVEHVAPDCRPADVGPIAFEQQLEAASGDVQV